MKTTHAVMSLFALSSLVASSASAATGAFDGKYDLHYGMMNMGVQCGYAAPDGTVEFDYVHYLLDLSESEQLPEDAFDAFLEQRYAQIEAADLGYYRETLAKANATVFFTGLRLALDEMVQSYPDVLEVSQIDGAAQPTRFSYVFNGLMVDEDHGDSLSASGAMSSLTGMFVLQPAYAYGYYYDSVDSLHVLTAATQLGGSVIQRIGALRWATEKMNYDPYTGEVWGCGIDNLVGFEVTPMGEEATLTPVPANAYKLSSQPVLGMKAQLHQASTRQLVKEGVQVKGRVAAEVAAVGRALTR